MTKFKWCWCVVFTIIGLLSSSIDGPGPVSAFLGFFIWALIGWIPVVFTVWKTYSRGKNIRTNEILEQQYQREESNHRNKVLPPNSIGYIQAPMDNYSKSTLKISQRYKNPLVSINNNRTISFPESRYGNRIQYYLLNINFQPSEEQSQSYALLTIVRVNLSYSSTIRINEIANNSISLLEEQALLTSLQKQQLGLR